MEGINELCKGEKQLSHGERRSLRDRESRPRLAALQQKVIILRQGALPKGLIARACDYALRLWSRLEVYLEDGQVQIDNNEAERSIRPVALGRKNWLNFGSKEGGPRIAAILSVVETCQRNRVPVREYLLDVLPRLAGGQQADVARLTPQAWAESRARAAAQSPTRSPRPSTSGPEKTQIARSRPVGLGDWILSWRACPVGVSHSTKAWCLSKRRWIKPGVNRGRLCRSR